MLDHQQCFPATNDTLSQVYEEQNEVDGTVEFLLSQQYLEADIEYCLVSE